MLQRGACATTLRSTTAVLAAAACSEPGGRRRRAWTGYAKSSGCLDLRRYAERVSKLRL